MVFSNWYLTERLALTIAFTNTNLPCRFRVVNKYLPTTPWEEGSVEVVQDGPFEIKLTHYYDDDAWGTGYYEEGDEMATRIDVSFLENKAKSSFFLGEIEALRKIKERM